MVFRGLLDPLCTSSASKVTVALLFVGLTCEWDTEDQDRPHMTLAGL